MVLLLTVTSEVTMKPTFSRPGYDASSVRLSPPDTLVTGSPACSQKQLDFTEVNKALWAENVTLRAIVKRQRIRIRNLRRALGAEATARWEKRHA